MIEVFRSLKEVMALENKIKRHMDVIDEEKKRISFIENQRKLKQDKLEEQNKLTSSVRAKSTSDENELEKIDSQIERVKQRIPLLKTDTQIKATEQEAASLDEKKDQLETTLLEEIEQLEQLSDSIKEHENFLKGSIQTLADINKEVDEKTAKENKEINNLQTRVSALLEDIPLQYRNKYHDVNKRYLFNNPLTSEENGICEICQMQITSLQHMAIEKMATFEACSGCNRIFLPHKVAHNL
ncbi:MAG: hypothetical protein HOE90_09435 [Bacteriovoracaceae bacterium]|jgi:predicted  nucleic acid-binding Zn-ribbon protein|nr:hypothetical protein [Bacteriovoracaceae bacterium]